MILIVAPEICRTGGVQAFSLEVVNACTQLVGSSNVTVFSRNDDRSDLKVRLGLYFDTFDLGSLSKPLRKLFLKPVARKLIQQLRPQIVICTHPQMVPCVSGSRVPILGVCHGIDAWNMNRSLKHHLRRADRILAVSRFTQNQMTQQVPELASKTFVFPNTYDSDRYHLADRDVTIRRRFQVPDDAFLLLSVARLARSEASKGYDDVIRSLPTILASRPNTYFLLGGKGDDVPRVRRISQDLGVIDHCRFPGFIEDSDLPALYRSADLFVLPSRKEGFGIVFLEALACGTPVIAGNADGSRDAVLDGEIGTLVTPGNIAELTSAILTVFNRSPEQRVFYRQQHSRRVFDEFGRHHFRDRLRQHLSELNSAFSETTPVLSLT